MEPFGDPPEANNKVTHAAARTVGTGSVDAGRGADCRSARSQPHPHTGSVLVYRHSLWTPRAADGAAVSAAARMGSRYRRNPQAQRSHYALVGAGHGGRVVRA